MKTISARILFSTVALLAFVLICVGFWTFTLLKSESRVYTFQSQLLQTQLVGKPLMNQIDRIQGVLDDLLRRSNKDVTAVSSQVTKDDESKLGIQEIQKLNREDGHWVFENAEDGVDSLQALLQKLPEKGLYLDSVSSESHTVGLARLGSEVGFIAVFSIAPIISECAGLPVFAVSSQFTPLFSCDQSVQKEVGDPQILGGEKFTTAFKKIRESKFAAGSFEGEESNNDLWSYYQANDLFRVIGMVPTQLAFRPAYFLALRLSLLLLASLGIAILISVGVARRVAEPIVTVTNATLKIAEGDFDVAIDVKSKDETAILAQAVVKMAQKIKSLIQSEIEKSKLESQLEIAGTVQKTLIPKSSLSFSGIRMESFYLPADQCGGDWWGYVKKDSKIYLLIGDVTGHGYPSALLVATTRGFLSMLQTSLDQTEKFEWNPASILLILNQVVFDATQGQINMTAQCVSLDLSNGQFQLASAGHNPAYILNTETAELTGIMTRGTRLGEAYAVESPYKMKSGELKVNEKLILYTDGIQDLGVDGKELGRTGWMRFLREHAKDSSADLVKSVQDTLIPLNQGRSLLDDITLVSIERSGPEKNL